MGKALKKLAVAVGLGALAGYVAGILTAPKSGKETREDLKHAARTGLSEGEKQLKKILAELSELIADAKRQGTQLGDKAAKELDSLTAKAKLAREKAREVISAIHEGDVEDNDLQEALKGANEALQHLRTYLKK